MEHIRYEQYINFTENFPAIIHTNIMRNSSNKALQMNFHENLEIEYCISGEGFVQLNGEKISVKKGDIVIVNSNVIHYTGSESNIVYECIIFDSEFCKNAGIDCTLLTFNRHFKDDVTASLFKKIIDTYKEENSSTKIAKMQVAILNFLMEIRKNHIFSTSENIDTVNKSFKVVKEAIRFMNANYSKKIYIDDIAEELYIDKYSLSRAFKSFTGTTLINYLNSYRCEKAAELINNGLPVNIAAEKCGFNNISFFTKIFKKSTGKLPKEYKKH